MPETFYIKSPGQFSFKNVSSCSGLVSGLKTLQTSAQKYIVKGANFITNAVLSEHGVYNQADIDGYTPV